MAYCLAKIICSFAFEGSRQKQKQISAMSEQNVHLHQCGRGGHTGVLFLISKLSFQRNDFFLGATKILAPSYQIPLSLVATRLNLSQCLIPWQSLDHNPLQTYFGKEVPGLAHPAALGDPAVLSGVALALHSHHPQRHPACPHIQQGRQALQAAHMLPIHLQHQVI